MKKTQSLSLIFYSSRLFCPNFTGLFHTFSAYGVPKNSIPCTEIWYTLYRNLEYPVLKFGTQIIYDKQDNI